jgi:very-short-patch-repair endonuclease
LVNATVTDDEGTVAGEVDLLDPAAGLAGEYDGGHHAPADQRAHDHARAERLEALGLTVVRLAAPDLSRFRSQTVQRLQRLHRRGLARDRTADRWSPARPR